MSDPSARVMYQPTSVVGLRSWVRYLTIVRIAAFVGILCAPFSLWALFWTSPRDYPFLPSMLFVPLVLFGCIMLFNRVWRRDKFVRLLFGTGIAVRFAATGAYVWLGFFVFNVAVDAFHYWTVGLYLANDFAGIGWAAFRPPWTSSNLISNLCGIITLVTGNAMPTLFVIFALAALWGGYFFYRAFCIAFPEGNRGLYGLLVVLLPSIVYWSSAIGKDALEQLFIGISALGFAKVATKLNGTAILLCAIGIAGAAVVRPHVGAMLAISMLVPFVLGRTRGGWVTVSAKVLLVPVVAAASFFMVRQAQTFVGVEGADFGSSVERVDKQSGYTRLGNSTFNEGESLSRRMIQGPFLTFRPFPWEVHNAMSAVAALEGLGLLLLAWRKRRVAWTVARQWREPYVLFILVFALEFSVIFAGATSNFGLLVRQRIMLIPIVLMLFCAKLPVSRAVAGLAPVQRNYGFRSRLPAPHSGRSIS